MTKPKRIDLTPEELDALLGRVETGCLQPGDFELIKAMAETIAYLSVVVEKKGVSIARLLRNLFGQQSEKSRDVLKRDSKAQDESEESDNAATSNGAAPSEPSAEENEKDEEPAPGHGRRPASDYTAAQTVQIKHESLKAGDSCPSCQKGTVYNSTKPGVIVRVRATPPLQATIYELEKLRCHLCGKIFTAKEPEGVGSAKYDEGVVSMIALLKYGMGVPFHRLDRIQEALGTPLSSSTQWDILDAEKEKFQPVLDELYRQAAHGDIVHNDDTTVKVLELMGKRREKNPPENPERTGMYTTGIVSRRGERTIALYFSGSRHAGENLDRLLALRTERKGPPVQMCDGLEHNVPKEAKTLVGNCLSHGRRQFIDVLENFPAEVAHLLEEIAKVYAVEKKAAKKKLSARERLRLHRRESAPRMKKLKKWLDEQIEEKKVEPNSSLGGAIQYMQKRWERLTLFLREVGAPLDNNLVERVLKRAILLRKNSLFYRSERGAALGDLFLSLIETTTIAGENPFNYLTELQRNAEALAERPSDWMPWNYRETLARQSATTNARTE